MTIIKRLSVHPRLTATIALTTILLVQVFIFGSHVGAGFVTDDFNWLESVVRNGKIDYLRAFTATTGFFRPLVGISFAVQYQLHGMNARMFGLFNLLLHMLNILLIYFLLYQFPKTRKMALPITLLFALNAKANEMAVRWISSRTSLLCVFFMLLSLLLLVTANKKEKKITRFVRYTFIILFYLTALLAKETAVAMPIFIFLYTFFHDGNSNSILQAPFGKKIRKSIMAILPFIIPLAVYFFLRFNSDAVTPFNAPPYYRLSFSPGLLLKNIFEYILRAGIFDILAMALLLLTGWKIRKNQNPIKTNPGIFILGSTWFLCFLLPVIGLSARSDLYAYFPQIGLHVMTIAFIYFFFDWSFLEAENPSQRGKPFNHDSFQKWVVFVSLVIVFLVWTVYLRNRAETFSKSPQLSALFTTELLAQTSALKPGSRLWILDQQAAQKESPTHTIAYGFNAMLNLYYPGKNLTGDIIPPERTNEWESQNTSTDICLIWDGNTLKKKE